MYKRQDYKYKMNLMTEIAAKEEFSGLDAVSELLKDKDIETNEQGRDVYKRQLQECREKY